MSKVILRASKIGVGIVLPLIILGLVLYVLKVTSVAQVGEPIVQDVRLLEESAAAYVQDGFYAEAEQAFLSIIAQVPGTQEAFGAQKSLVNLHVMQQDQPAAAIAMQRLLEDYSDNESLPDAVHEIVEESLESNQCETIRSVCQGLHQRLPQSDEGVWLQMGVALSNSYLGDDEALDLAVQNLSANFLADRRCAEAFRQIALSYHKQNKYQMARELNQYVVDNWPGEDCAIFSQRDLVFVSISLNDEEAASQAEDGLLRDFPESQHLAECVGAVAKRYMKAKKNVKARDLYAYAVDNFSSDENTLWLQMGLAITSIRLGENDTASWAVDQLFTQNSEHKRIASAARQIADAYRKKKRYDLSGELYDYVINTRPETGYALWSKVGLVVTDIELGNDPNAEDKTQQLMTDYAGDARFTNAARSIGNEFRRARKFRQARDIYQYEVDTWPDAKDRISAVTNLAVSSIECGDEQTTADAVDDLLLNYINDERIADAICGVASHYSMRGKNQQAHHVYRRFLDNWSNPELEIGARIITVIIGDDPADPNSIDRFIADNNPADPSAVDRLIADFAGHRQLVQMAVRIPEHFYTRAFDLERKGLSGQARKYFEIAAKEWEAIVTQLPETAAMSRESYQAAGDCYRRLGEHEKALEFYLHIVETWPDWERLWHTQFLIGRSYQAIKHLGLLDASQADRKHRGSIVVFSNCTLAARRQRLLQTG